ncbi:hypothetical protein DRH29_00375 [candidate division Kazan bacterium]|uniref:Glycosyltransferase family 1 protein n=1 Tax=candidate division Kazan bacterium TaxID=2202143 RepID=A0A420ZDN2_UNCK3|nr:MAG: hypothetical protein DRH29_00375 [candidate division Kazan bacterium]
MSKRISVFEIIADSSLTGAPRHLLTLMSGIDKVKFIPTVITPAGPLVAELKKRKIPVFQVPMKGRADRAAINAIFKLLKKYEPDIIHTHGQRAGLVGRLASRSLHIKRIHTEHTYTHDFRLGNPLLHVTHLQVMKALDRWTDKVIAVSNAVKKFLIESKITKPDKITVVYNGITPLRSKISEKDIEEFRKKNGIQPEDFIIGTVGSLNPAKDTATLIKAFARIAKSVPRAKLVIVGRGHLKHFLERLAKKQKIEDKVVFTGSLANVLPALSTFKIFVLPSLSEAFGITLLEAMKVGVPIVATRVGGIPEIITHNHNGLLVEPKSPKKLSATLLKLINDKKLMRKLCSNHAKTVEKFSAETMIRKTEDVYKSLFK